MRTVWVAGGSIVAVVAVAAAVTAGTGSGGSKRFVALTSTAPGTTAPGTTAPEIAAPDITAPGTTAPKPADVSKLFDYAAVSSAYGSGTDADQAYRTKLPTSAARDTMTVLNTVDTSLAHARALKAASADVKIVPDGSDHGLHQMILGSAWTVDGVAPLENTYTRGGDLEIGFGDSHAMLGAPGYPQSPDQPCGIEPADLGLVHGGDPNAPWTPCTVRTLSDGSTVSTSSSQRGPGTITFAVREFAGDRGGITITAADFPLVTPPSGGQLDAAHVLSPSPWTEQSLAAALSSPDLVPAL
jgi:hypothetical protein